MPEAIYRDHGHPIRALPYPALQMASRHASDGLKQEGHERPSALAHAGLWLLSHRLVYGPSHSRGDGPDQSRLARLAVPARSLKPIQPTSAARNPTSISSSATPRTSAARARSEEHTSELQSLRHLVCRLL